MTQRYLGGIITANPVEPSSNLSTASASGMWTLQEALSFYKAGDWPDPTNTPTVGLFAGGIGTDGSTQVNEIDTITPETLGDSTDFGDLSGVRSNFSATCSSTRGVTLGGRTPSIVGTVDYITIASQGNAVDFGDFSSINRNNQCHASGSQVKAIYAGFQSDKRVTDFLVPQTTGNGTDFATLTNDHQNCFTGGNLTRIIVAGGRSTYPTDSMEYNSVASSSGWSDFGDLSANSGQAMGGSVSSSTRMVIAGGTRDAFVITNEMWYLEIATTGNAVDFGDLTTAKRGHEARNPSSASVTG